jgi:hypothetical protein
MVAVAALILAGGIAVAATRVLAPAQHVLVPDGRRGRAQATVVAHGGTDGLQWRLAMRSCHSDGSVATAVVLGGVGGGYGTCQPGNARQLMQALQWTWTPGVSVVSAVVKDEVASVHFYLRRPKWHPSGRTTYRHAVSAVVHAQPVPRDISAGPNRLRFVVTTRPYRVEVTRVIARDASGRTLLDCAIRDCPH